MAPTHDSIIVDHAKASALVPVASARQFDMADLGVAPIRLMVDDVKAVAGARVASAPQFAASSLAAPTAILVDGVKAGAVTPRAAQRQFTALEHAMPASSSLGATSDAAIDAELVGAAPLDSAALRTLELDEAALESLGLGAWPLDASALEVLARDPSALHPSDDDASVRRAVDAALLRSIRDARALDANALRAMRAKRDASSEGAALGALRTQLHASLVRDALVAAVRDQHPSDDTSSGQGHAS